MTSILNPLSPYMAIKVNSMWLEVIQELAQLGGKAHEEGTVSDCSLWA